MDSSGSIDVRPLETEEFILSASAQNSSERHIMKALTVHVQAPRDIAKPFATVFQTSSQRINKGERVTLRWSVENADEVAIYPDIGPVDSTGSLKLFPETTVTYRLTARGAGGRAVATDRVEVASRSGRIRLYASNGVVSSSSDYGNAAVPIGYALETTNDPDPRRVYQVIDGSTTFGKYATTDKSQQGPTFPVGFLSSEGSDETAVYQVVGGTPICWEWNGVLVTDKNKLRKYGCPPAQLFGHTVQ